jgi:hypothetical protein
MRSDRELQNFVVETFSICTDSFYQPCTYGVRYTMKKEFRNLLVIVLRKFEAGHGEVILKPYYPNAGLQSFNFILGATCS